MVESWGGNPFSSQRRSLLGSGTETETLSGSGIWRGAMAANVRPARPTRMAKCIFFSFCLFYWQNFLADDMKLKYVNEESMGATMDDGGKEDGEGV